MDVKKRVESAVAETSSLDGMRRSFKTIKDRQAENSKRIADLGARKERLRAMKEAAVGDKTLLEQAVATLRGNGFRVVLAKTRDAALKAIREEVRGYDLVVKSKSNVTKDLHLAEHLGREGIEVVETDLGDRIIQLAGCPAAHPTGPACHMTRQEIAALFTGHFGRPVSDDPMELTSTMRDEIASYLARAKVGITGANAVTASEGAVVIVHNEGNAAKCAMLPDRHIVVTTPDKVVPTLEDAMAVVKLQTYLSTGKVLSSFINVITGPSYTADIEKKVYRGMHGPKDVVIVMVDDGRLAAEDKEPQLCIGCGMCLIECPVYNAVGPVFGTSGHMGGHGAYLSGSLGRLEESLDAGLYLCAECGACTEVCPSRIDTKGGVKGLRGQSRSKGAGTMPEHDAVVASIRNYDNPWSVPRSQKSKWSKGLGLKPRGEVLYFAGCSASLLSPETGAKMVEVFRAMGTEPAYLGQSERCCGSMLRKIGEEALARKKAEECFADFAKGGARTVVTSCPGCASALNHFEDLPEAHGVEVLHVSQYLDRHIDRVPVQRLRKLGKVTFHDPCDLGRALGIYDEPRRVLAAVTGSPPVEMERSREHSYCCGSGAGVRSAFPALSDQVSRDRLRMAREAGADMVVTSCPWCVQSLRQCQDGEAKTEVFDLVDLVHRAIRKG
ncbi:MAG: LUD domain-containing protein [Candidatus Thermoplasmatota archaeon]